MDQLRLRARDLRNNSTDAERHLWRHLRLSQVAGFKFRRQVPIGGYIADFVCAKEKLVVELDGGQHAEQVEYDVQRTRALEANGYRVVRCWNDDVLLRTEDVLDDILRSLHCRVGCKDKSNIKSTPPRPSPSLREREGGNGNGNSDSYSYSYSDSDNSKGEGEDE